MEEYTIKLVDKNTDLSHVKPLKWDVVIKGRPYYVAHIPGYIHTLRGWGEPIDLWAWPRDEKPSYKNLIEYDLHNPVAWGIQYIEDRAIKGKWDETEVDASCKTIITRNEKPFYTVRGDKSYSIPRALMLIEEIQWHPINFNEIDYQNQVIGRKIWYRSQPAIITHYCEGQCCVIAEPDGKMFFDVPPEFQKNEDGWLAEPEQSIKIDCLEDNHVWWWRD